MAIDPVDVEGLTTSKRPPKERKQSQPKQYNHQKSGSGGCHSRIRKPVLALCKVTNAAAAAQPAKNLKAALLEAEQGNEPVDGGLLGMAAAQAGRLGLKDLLNTLCAYSWPRLSCCGGREVAELAAAASKCGCDDDRFFGFVAVYCCQYADAFGCLRDVALVATALTRKLDSKVDVASAFHGLTVVALKHLNTSRASYTQCPIRDIAEFFYSLVNLLGTSSGTALCALDIARDVIVAMATSVRPQLHKASAQDIAKTTGAASMAWTLFPQLQDQVLMPLLQELAQAVRFRHTDFNAQDVAHLCVAFAKVDGIPDFSTSLPVLLDKVLDNLAIFSSKDLSLVSWAASRSQYIGDRCSGHVTKEVLRRDLSAFSAQDLCMMAQCLAKMGGRGKAALCLVAGQVFARQAQGLNTTDKVLFLWALAKCKVMHLALCRLIVRDLAVENCGSLPRDKVGLALWSLAVVWSSLPDGETWREMLATSLLASQPWLMAPAYEVTNAAWAFSQLPSSLSGRSWPSLLQTMSWVQPKQLSEHELCNLLFGLSSCTVKVAMFDETFARFSGELAARLDGRYFSEHDRRLLVSCFSKHALLKSLEESIQEKIKVFLGVDTREDPSPTAPEEFQDQTENPAEEQDDAHGAEVPPPPPTPTEKTTDDKTTEWDHGHHGHNHGHQGHGCGETCYNCEVAPTGASSSDLSRLRLNYHCNYKGHCVQLKHTFIHVDCPAESDSEEDCMLCNMSRRRARSMDSKGLDILDAEPIEPRRRGRQQRSRRSGSSSSEQAQQQAEQQAEHQAEHQAEQQAEQQ